MKKQKTEMTIMSAMSQIVDVVRLTDLSEEYLKKVKAEFKYLQERLQWTQMQSIVMSVVMNEGEPLSHMRIACQCSMSALKMMSYEDLFCDLVERGYMVKVGGKKRPEFHVPSRVVNALKENKPYEPPMRNGLDEDEFLKQLDDVLREVSHARTCEKVAQLDSYLKGNEHLPFVKKFRAKQLDEVNGLFFLMVVSARVNDDESVLLDHLKSYVDDFRPSRRLVSELLSGRSELLKKNLLEEDGIDFMGSHQYTITLSAKDEFLPGYEFESMSAARNRKDCLHWEDQANVPLYYNNNVEAQMQQLCDLLKEDNFKGIQQRLKAKGQQVGFACLLCGPAGTGKTQSVKMLSRETQRDIIQVDLSQVRDKYFGESEKRVKRIFTNYKDCCKDAERLPILLLNECDGLLTKRLSKVERSVDQVTNAIQNIILQEMEDFEGILIATTNLTTNLDDAVFRRFLFKVELQLPDADTRAKIWKSKFDKLSKEKAHLLADEFVMSGGLIENVNRKALVNEILYGTKPTYELLRQFCQEEQAVGNTPKRIAIGF